MTFIPSASNASNPPKFVSHSGQGQFASVVGEYDHEVVLAGGEGEPHARFDLNVNGKQDEADINVHSVLNPDGTPGGSDVEYAIKDQVVPSMPTDGIHTGDTFSYADQGLTAADFKTVSDDTLHQQLSALARSSQKIELLGKTYSDAGKTGIHDIHMNSGEGNPKFDDPGHDGVARFYTTAADGQIHQQSVYIMFQNQHLPDGSGSGQ